MNTIVMSLLSGVAITLMHLQKKEFRQKVKDSFKEEFGIDLVDDEIINITKSFRIKKNS